MITKDSTILVLRAKEVHAGMHIVLIQIRDDNPINIATSIYYLRVNVSKIKLEDEKPI